MVKMGWEKDAIISWSDWWGSSRFHIRKLRIKSGETQSKWVFPTMLCLQNISVYTIEVIFFFLHFCPCDPRVIFSAKDGEFVHLIRGGDEGVFVKSKEDNMSRKEKL